MSASASLTRRVRPTRRVVRGPSSEKSTPLPAASRRPLPRQPVPVDGIEFTGRLQGKGEVKFVLLYTPRAGR